MLFRSHTATPCNALRHTATHCNTLQHTATHCNTLQHTATHCNTLQRTATHCNTLCVAKCCSVLQCVAVCCSVLQCVAVCRSTRQCHMHTHTDTHRIPDWNTTLLPPSQHTHTTLPPYDLCRNSIFVFQQKMSQNIHHHLSHTHTLSLSHTHSLSLSLSHTLSFSLSVTHTLIRRSCLMIFAETPYFFFNKKEIQNILNLSFHTLSLSHTHTPSYDASAW